MEALGVFMMAFGADKYIRQAETLALSLRRHMPELPIAIASDRRDFGASFDRIVPMDVPDRAGTVLKIAMYELSPFQETLFIDTDCIVVRPFRDELAALRRFDFTPVVSRYLAAGDTDLWLDDVGAALERVGGHRFPKFNGGVYYFRKGPTAERVFSLAGSLRARAKELGIKDFDAAGPGEETLIGLALAQLGIDDLYDDEGRLMRTPLNSEGRIEIDPLGGGCRFVKEGRLVEPAICHFCGEWQTRPEYRLAEAAIRNGRKPSKVYGARVWGGHYARKLRSKVERRLGL